MDVRIQRVAGAEAAARAAAELLVAAVRDGGGLALSGGTTPGAAYAQAAVLEPDWSRATVWLADERCVPAADPRANARLVRETILDRVAAQPTVMKVETDLDPDTAAARYDGLLRERGVPGLVLLGVGADGHTASLFPGAPSLAERTRLAVAADAGLEPFVRRVTLTLAAIAKAEHVVFLVTGAAKAEQVRRAFVDPASDAVPASRARSGAGTTTLIVDEAAAAGLD